MHKSVCTIFEEFKWGMSAKERKQKGLKTIVPYGPGIASPCTDNYPYKPWAGVFSHIWKDQGSIAPNPMFSPHGNTRPQSTAPENGISPALKRRLALFFAVIGFALYANTIPHEYALDDVAVITQNSFTQQGFHGIDDLLTGFYWSGYWNLNAGLYRPLPMLTFAIEWQFFPGNPHVGHLVNALLYALSGFLLFYFLCALLPGYRIYVPFIATLIFLVHPVHTEVVANIKSRDELFCLLFFILAARLWLHASDPGKRALVWWAAGVYFLSLMSKEGGVFFLPLFPLMLWFFREERMWASVKKAWPLAVSLGVYLAIHTAVTQSADAPRLEYTYQDNSLLAATGFAGRIATALGMQIDYLRLLFWPHPLCYDYSFNQIPVIGFSHARAVAGLLLVVGLCVMAAAGLRRRNAMSFALCWFILTFALPSNLIVPIGATMAERFLFAPSLGFALVLALLADRYLVRKTLPTATVMDLLKHAPVAMTACAVIAGLMAFKTIDRNRDWKDDLSLFSTDVKTSPGSSRTHSNFGTAYMNQVALIEPSPKRKAELLTLPIREFNRALEIDPYNVNALQNLGICYYYTGDFEASKNHSQRCIDRNPGIGQAHAFLGKALFRLGDAQAAVGSLNRAVALGYEDHTMDAFFGAAYFKLGEYGASIRHYEACLKVNPLTAEILNDLASAYGNIGSMDRAIELFKMSFELNPKMGSTAYYLGAAYQFKGMPAEAEQWFARARELGVEF